MNISRYLPRYFTLPLIFIFVLGFFQLTSTGDDPVSGPKYKQDRKTWKNLLKKEESLVEKNQFPALAARSKGTKNKFDTDLFQRFCETRHAAWQTTESFFQTLTSWMETDSKIIRAVKIGSLKLKPGGADRKEVQMTSKGVKIPKPWTTILNRENGKFMDMLDLEKIKKKKDKYGLGVFLVMNGKEREGMSVLSDLYSAGKSWKKKLNNFVSMLKRVKIPADGFVVFDGQIVTRKEREKLKERKKKADSDEWVKYKGEYIPKEEYMKKQGKVKYRGKWMDKEKAERLKKKNRIHFSFTWTFADDLSKEEFKKKKDRAKMWWRHFWKVGEGNFAIKSPFVIKDNVTDKSKRGDFHTPAGKKNKQMLSGKRYARTYGRYPDGYIKLAGRCDPFTWLHELGHLLFSCEEEYDSENGCPCVMSTGAKNGKYQWCDSETHSKEQAKQQKPCWEGYILKKYPNATHPGPGGERPDIKVKVENN